jgi:hypothetical protein
VGEIMEIQLGIIEHENHAPVKYAFYVDLTKDKVDSLKRAREILQHQHYLPQHTNSISDVFNLLDAIIAEVK